MPYLMGGYPSIEESVAAGLAAADAGADLLELGIPFSDPLADGPVIHAAGTAALAAGVTPHGVLGCLRTACGEGAGRPDGVRQHRADRRRCGLCAEGGLGGCLRAHRSRTCRTTRPARCGPRATPRGSRSCRSWRRPRRRSGSRPSAPTRAGSSTPCPLTGTTGERDEIQEGLAQTVERVRASTDVPVAVGFGISTPEQARAVAELADGVIVGSRGGASGRRGRGGGGGLGGSRARCRVAGLNGLH